MRPKHELRLHPAPFDKIRSGSKIYELRLNDAKRQLIQPGDVILFLKRPEETERMMAKVIARHEFASFSEMMQNIPPAQAGYEGVSLQKLNEGDHGMYAHYSPEDEQRFGVVALQLEVLR